MNEYYEGNNLRHDALAFCGKCQMPITGTQLFTIGGQPVCPACDVELVLKYIQLIGFGLRLEADFPGEKGKVKVYDRMHG